jgi:type VI secretion system protein ImpH
MSELTQLRDEPHRFSLFAALRLLERVHADRPRFGESRRASEDAVRLAQPPFLTFVPTEIVGLQAREGGLPRLEQYTFGQFGPNGPLPLHFTEIAYERQRQLNDPTFSDFVNFIQHRLIALFYRAWAESDPATCRDRPDSDRFELYVGSLLGLGFASSAARDAVLDQAKLSRAAQFGAHARSAEGLQDVLASYFELPIEVHSFAPAWLEIPPSCYTRLGRASENAQLGLGTMLGSASWQSQHQFAITLGPVPLVTFEQFLPGTQGLREFAALVRLYTNDEWSWLLRLRLAAQEVPPLRLGLGARVGWTSWVGGRSAVAEDVIIRGDGCGA